MAEGGNEKLLLENVPLDDAGEYEIPDPRLLEQLETYVPSCTITTSFLSNPVGLQVPNIRLLALLVASDPTFSAVSNTVSSPIKAVNIPESIAEV